MIDFKRSIFKNPRTYIILFTLILILTTGIIFKQEWFRMLPLCITLIVMMLQTKANKYAFIIGGLNSCIYGIVSISLELYADAANCFLVSFPMQVATFFLWDRRKYGNSTVFKRLDLKRYIITIALSVVSWLILFFSFKGLKSPYIIIDTTNTVLGIVSSILCMFAYSEYLYIRLVTGILGILTYLSMTLTDPAQITFLISNVYSYICTIASFIYVRQLMVEQKKYSKSN